MHADEVDTSVALVVRLLEGQFPDWANLPVSAVESSGTDNALYRLGEDLVARLPRIHWAVGQVEKEYKWLPLLAPRLPLAVPVPLAKGIPAEGYPWQWSVYKWIGGADATVERPADERQAALDLAQFVSALQGIVPAGEPPAMDQNSRGFPLAARDQQTRRAIAELTGMVDTDTATALWEAALRQPEWNREPVLFHGDLLPSNVLVQGGRIRAVIDFSNLGLGDPACDMMIAWGMLSRTARDMYRSALAVDDATWIRGRGHALSQALIFMPYYKETNPAGVLNARRALEEVMADYRSNG
jgi:aminoglycoside phosphotransferase (APT) family kinase protein